MANDLNTGVPEMDGSLHDAASAFALLDDPSLGDPTPGATVSPQDRERAPNGQFRPQKGPHPMAEVVDADAMERSKQTLKPGEVVDDAPPEVEAADEVTNPDDEFFEIELEKDGKPVKERLKATEVWQKAQDYDRVAREFEDYRRSNIAPEAWDQSIMQVQQVTDDLLQQLAIQRHMLRPQQPDANLLNPESPRYNPELYGRQTIAAQQQLERYNEIGAEMKRLADAKSAREIALNRAQAERWQAKTFDIWPELRDGSEVARVRDDAVKYWGKYGATPEMLGSIHHPAFFAMLKSALAHERGKQARETAVKVVRAKPKLVKGQAKGTASPQQAQYQSAMQRLNQTNSIEDAAAAFRALG